MSKWTREEQKKHSAEWTRQYEKGQQDERERIIKLFEDFIAKQSSYINDETPADIAEGYLVEIESAEYWIDRIKGENK